MSKKVEVPRCPKCHTGGYRQTEARDGRPEFECGVCGHIWTYGKDGGKYAKSVDQ